MCMCQHKRSSWVKMAKAEELRQQIQTLTLLQPSPITYLFFIALDFHRGKLVHVILRKCTAETNR